MDDSGKYIKMFVEESDEHLERMNDLLPGLEPGSSDPEALNTIFRGFHSIKGMAASLNFRQVQEVSHKLEDLLDGLRGGTITFSHEVLGILYTGLEILEELVRGVEEGREGNADLDPFWSQLLPILAGPAPLPPQPPGPPPEKEEIKEELSQEELEALKVSGEKKFKTSITIAENSISPPARAYLIINSLKEKGSIQKTIPPFEKIEAGNMERDFQVFLSSAQSKEELKALIEASVEIEKVEVEEIDVTSSGRSGDPHQLHARTPKPDEKALRYRKPGAVKVDTPVLDGLIDIVGEMFIQHNQLLDIARTMESPETTESVNRLEKLVRKLYKEVMTLRLVPVALLSDMFPRIIREVLKGSDKKVEVKAEGKEIKLDRSIVEKLGDPLIHLIRNSLDHGLESPEERLARGKPEAGTLTFRASKQKDTILIDLSDDGKGLDPEKIKEKAITKGLADKETMEKLSLQEIYNFIWNPGFSTAAQVTNVSGRGVGMDIVKNVLDSLGGRVTLTSEQGKGTTFHLEVPLTMAIIRTFRIKLEEDLYAVPMGKVVRTLDVPKEEISEKGEEAHFFYREEKVPLVDLKKRLHYEKVGFNGSKSVPVLIVEKGEEKVGLIVDAFLSSYETVVKSLGLPLERLDIFSGATMSEKGEIILIMDVDRLLQ